MPTNGSRDPSRRPPRSRATRATRSTGAPDLSADVVVVGGGPAGTWAAYPGARSALGPALPPAHVTTAVHSSDNPTRSHP